MQGSGSEKRDEHARKSSRRVAAERLSTPDQLDQVIEVARFPHWLLLAALTLLACTTDGGDGTLDRVAMCGGRLPPRRLLPPVLPVKPIVSVSPTSDTMCSYGMPIASAAICDSTVLEPWPMSVAP